VTPIGHRYVPVSQLQIFSIARSSEASAKRFVYHRRKMRHIGRLLLVRPHMTHPEYFVAFEDHSGSTLEAFAANLRSMPKNVAGTVQLSELCAMADHPNGLYLFFDDQDVLWYVGKSTSRSFIERVPSHFDQRKDAWFRCRTSKKPLRSTPTLDHGTHCALALDDMRKLDAWLKSKNIR
jgi:hypothetical protein